MRQNKYVAFVKEKDGNKYYTEYTNNLKKIKDWALTIPYVFENIDNIVLYEIENFSQENMNYIFETLQLRENSKINLEEISKKESDSKNITLITEEDLIKNKKYSRCLKI